MHLAPLIQDLAVILGVAAVVTLLFQKIKQPVVLGYILAGVLVGPELSGMVSDLPNIRVWADLGVIFLMFSLGLEFSFRKLAKVGISAATTAVFEVSLMGLLGFGVGRLMGWTKLDCVFLGAMLSISSTTVILKALDELKLKTRRFAELIFAVLIVEDLIAILLLVALSTLKGSTGFSGLAILISGAKLLLVIGSWFLTGYFLVPRFVRYVGKTGNDEVLTILSIGLCLGLVVIAAKLEYSVALGAFIMGSILAESTESFRIEELIRPLRDLFAAIFFVSVGMLISPKLVLANKTIIIALSATLIIGKIVFITLGSLLTGQTLRTSVQVGFGMAQIGEFSFIIAGLGAVLAPFLGLQHDFYPIAVGVSVITAFTTPYFIRVSHKYAVFLERKLPHSWKNALSHYASWSVERRADTHRRADFYKRVLRWVLNGILVTVIFTLSSEFLRWGGVRWIGWAIALVLSAPFLWGMYFSFEGFRFVSVGGDEKDREGTKVSSILVIFLSRLFEILWTGLLSLEFFQINQALALTTILIGILVFGFRKRLGASYHWFESEFLSTFKTVPKSKKATDVLRGLAPWDAHLVRLKVHPNSEVAGQKISQSDLRAKHGLSVIVIQRGLKTLVAPDPSEVIYPKDELLVLGTDEEVDAARKHIEKPPGLSERFRHLSGYELRQVLVTEESSFKDLSIRDSGIRERTGGMVVGLERGDTRMINPNSSLILKAGDVLWIVGESEKLQRV